MIIGGVTVVNPEIRKLFRPLFLHLMPNSLSDQLLRLFTEVGMMSGVKCSPNHVTTSDNGSHYLWKCCYVHWILIVHSS